MSKRSSLRKVLYLDINDTIEEVGISRRQLKYWEENGLLTPELGAEAKRYTESDIARLKDLKHLIVEQRFPIPFVSQLLDGESIGENQDPLNTSRFLDLDAGSLVTKEYLARQLWDEFGAVASEEEVEQRFYNLALLLFRLVRLRNRSESSYKGRRDEIFNYLWQLERVARIERDAEGDQDTSSYAMHGYTLVPTIEGDSWGGTELRDTLVEHYGRLSGFRHAADRLVQKGELSARQMARFWSQQTIQALQAPLTPGGDAFDDVPF